MAVRVQAPTEDEPFYWTVQLDCSQCDFHSLASVSADVIHRAEISATELAFRKFIAMGWQIEPTICPAHER